MRYDDAQAVAAPAPPAAAFHVDGAHEAHRGEIPVRALDRAGAAAAAGEIERTGPLAVRRAVLLALRPICPHDRPVELPARLEPAL